MAGGKIKHPVITPTVPKTTYEGEDYHLVDGVAGKLVLATTDVDNTPTAGHTENPISSDHAKTHEDLIVGAHGATATPTAGKIPIADGTGKLDGWVTAGGGAAVLLTGNQTVAGIKTFTSSPVVPTPTTDLQAATKKYVDDNAVAGGNPRRSVVLTIAAHDATADEITQSDYQCTGTNDETVWEDAQEAINTELGTYSVGSETFNSYFGTIKLSSGEFKIQDNVTLKTRFSGQVQGSTMIVVSAGKTITLQGQGSIGVDQPCGDLEEVSIRTAAATTTPVVLIDAPSGERIVSRGYLRNVSVLDNATAQTGTGVKIQATGASMACLASCVIGPLSIYGFEHALYVTASGTGGSYVNSNVFPFFKTNWSKYGVYLYGTETNSCAVWDNRFLHCEVSPHASSHMTAAVTVKGFAKYNRFNGHVWDWDNGLDLKTFVVEIDGSTLPMFNTLTGYWETNNSWTIPTASVGNKVILDSDYSVPNYAMKPYLVSADGDGDFKNLTTMYSTLAGTSSLVYDVMVRGIITETAAVTVEPDINVWAMPGSEVQFTMAAAGGPIYCNANSKNFIWQNVVVRKLAASVTDAGYRSVIGTAGGDYTGQFINCQFINEQSTGAAEMGIYSLTNGMQRFTHCRFVGTGIGANCCGAYLINSGGGCEFIDCDFASDGGGAPGSASGVWMNQTGGMTSIKGGSMNGEAYGLRIQTDASKAYWKISKAIIETTDTSSPVAVYAAAAVTLAPIYDCQLLPVTATMTNITSLAVQRNTGLYRTCGTATVDNGATTEVVTHGLGQTPTYVLVSPTKLSAVTHWWVDTKGATEFTINVDQDPGAGTATFDWMAVL